MKRGLVWSYLFVYLICFFEFLFLLEVFFSLWSEEKKIGLLGSCCLLFDLCVFVWFLVGSLGWFCCIFLLFLYVCVGYMFWALGM